MYKGKKVEFCITEVVKKICPEEREYIQDYAPPKIGSLFLVMSQNNKYIKFETAIKSYFKNIYMVHMAKDYAQDTLTCVCEKIRDADYGIVILAGLKGFQRKGKKLLSKMNIPFEYGMLKILNKPVMLIREEKSNIDIDKEFSDIKNENWGEKISLRSQQRTIENKLGKMFKKFIPELATKTADREVRKLLEKADLSHSDKIRLLSELKNMYETQIRKDFKNKVTVSV